MNRMVKILAAFSVLFMGTARAQSSMPLTTTIPFDFFVGDKLLPAGDYISVIDVRSHEIVMLSADGGTGVLGLYFLISNEKNAVPGTSQLVFNKYSEDRIFLSRIWHENVRTGVELPKSRREREAVTTTLITHNQPATVTVLARTH
jgi:hypothetical protein